MLETRVKKANKVIKIIGLSIAGAVLLFALTIGGLCWFGGYQIVHVVGDSAIQSIKPFSLILIQPCKVEDLKSRDVLNGVNMGDFAVRIQGTSYVTHEVCAKEYNEETGEWVFDTVSAAGDPRQNKTDGNGKCTFTQDDLVGKVVLKEVFIGKLIAWVQGRPSIETSLNNPPDKTLAIVRIVTLGVILIGISKFAEFVAYKDDIY